MTNRTGNPTPGQTVGPFFHFGLEYQGDRDLVPPGSADSILLHGHVYDGAGAGIPDALVELWQPRTDGTIPRQPGSIHRDGSTFTGFGRASTDSDGRYAFTTLVPGPVAPGKAAFFALTVFARGLLDRLFTRAYLPFQAQPEGVLEVDPLLASLPAARRGTLMTVGDRQGFAFDIHVQGESETVFLTFADRRGGT